LNDGVYTTSPGREPKGSPSAVSRSDIAVAVARFAVVVAVMIPSTVLGDSVA
jgi:hypothetical protein